MDGLKCDGCNLTIEKTATIASFKPGFAVPVKLHDHNMVKQAYETGVCPLCGREINKVSNGENAMRKQLFGDAPRPYLNRLLWSHEFFACSG